MSAFNLETCVRPNILALEPYRCARDDYKDDGTNVLLDANENAFGPAVDGAAAAGLGFDPRLLHRYPDPHQRALKERLCELRNTHAHTASRLTAEHVFVGVGSDEAIDALLRCFCVPGRDRVLTCPPTYGMYAVSAQVNDVGSVRVPLGPAPGFALDVEAVCGALAREPHVKLVYLCSPGNPTGAALARADVERVLDCPGWNGVVVLDEAYVDFAGEGASLAELVADRANLVVMQTLSKAFGMAGIRLGAAFAAPPVARLLNALRAPYNVSTPTAALALAALSPPGLAAMRANRDRVRAQRDRLRAALPALHRGVGRLRGGTDANFLLVELLDPRGRPDNAVALAVYEGLARTRGVVVRFRGREHGCQGCLRITVGTEQEVTRLLAELRAQLDDVHARAPPADEAEDRDERDANAVVA